MRTCVIFNIHTTIYLYFQPNKHISFWNLLFAQECFFNIRHLTNNYLNKWTRSCKQPVSFTSSCPFPGQRNNDNIQLFFSSHKNICFIIMSHCKEITSSQKRISSINKIHSNGITSKTLKVHSTPSNSHTLSYVMNLFCSVIYPLIRQNYCREQNFL